MSIIIDKWWKSLVYSANITRVVGHDISGFHTIRDSLKLQYSLKNIFLYNKCPFPGTLNDIIWRLDLKLCFIRIVATPVHLAPACQIYFGATKRCIYTSSEVIFLSENNQCRNLRTGIMRSCFLFNILI